MLSRAMLVCLQAHLKFVVPIMLLATMIIYLSTRIINASGSTPKTTEKLDAEICDDKTAVHPCDDLSNWLSRSGMIPGYHVCPFYKCR